MMPCRASMSKTERAFWAVVSSAACSVLFYEWSVVIRDYVEEPIRSQVFYKEPKTMPMPPLLLCQRQFYINETKANSPEENLNQNALRYLKIVSNPTGADPSLALGMGNDQDQARARSDYLAYVSRFGNNPWTAFERLMLSCDQLIRQCSMGMQNFSGEECCRRWALQRMTVAGPCLAIQPPNQDIPTADGGFLISLNLAQTVYNFAQGFRGFDLYIGDMVGKPMVPALLLADEDSYNLMLTATTYQNDVPQNCNKNLKPALPPVNLPAMDQAMWCASTGVYSRCRCNPVYQVQLDQGNDPYNGPLVFMPDHYHFCELQDIGCLVPMLNSSRDPANFTRITNQYWSGGLGCDLRPPCVDDRFHFAVAEYHSMPFPVGDYRAEVRLYYESFVLTKVDQKLSYNFHDVVVNMGGALTFWFVVVHILMYLASAVRCCLGRDDKSGNKVSGMENASNDPRNIRAVTTLPPLQKQLNNQPIVQTEPLPPIVAPTAGHPDESDKHQSIQTD